MRSPAEMELAVLLAFPPADQRDALLRAARLPVDARNRKILFNGLLRIKLQYARWEATGIQPDQGKPYREISEAANNLLKFMAANDSRHQAVSTMEGGTVWHTPIESPVRQLTALRDVAAFYGCLYSFKGKRQTRPDTGEEILYDGLYRLFARIKGARPGNTYLLYNFVKTSANLLGIKVGSVTPDAFRMRIKRMLDKQRKGFGSLAEIARDLPPADFSQLSDEALAMFGNSVFAGAWAQQSLGLLF